MSQEQNTPAVSANGSHIYTITTTLAAMFNLLVLLVICFGVMPVMDTSLKESRENRKATESTREMLRQNWAELEEHRAVVRRLNQLLDAAAAKARTIEDAKKKDK